MATAPTSSRGAVPLLEELPENTQRLTRGTIFAIQGGHTDRPFTARASLGELVDWILDDLNGPATPEYATAGGVAAWGSIAGTLALQADLAAALSAKLPLAGGTMTGAVDFGGFTAGNLADPALVQDAATKAYVDAAVSGAGAVWGGITGTLSAQTDLQAALDGKAPTAHTHLEADITDLQAYALASALTAHTGDATIHFTEASIAHGNIGGIGTNSHATIDAHIASAANPHAVTPAQLGLVIGTDVQAWDADLDIWATKAPPSGGVVGTTDTQTLSGKTLSAPLTVGLVSPTVDDADDLGSSSKRYQNLYLGKSIRMTLNQYLYLDDDLSAYLRNTEVFGLDNLSVVSDSNITLSAALFANTSIFAKFGSNVNTKFVVTRSGVNLHIFMLDGHAAINDAANVSNAQFSIRQESTTAARPVLRLDQQDDDANFLHAIGKTSATTPLTRSIVDEADVTTATRQGFLKISIADEGAGRMAAGDYFIPVFTLA